MHQNRVSAGQSRFGGNTDVRREVSVSPRVCTRTQPLHALYEATPLIAHAGYGSGVRPKPKSSLADRLAATREAELHLRASASCTHLGCSVPASSSVRGIPFCPGHAGFAAVSVLRGKVA